MKLRSNFQADGCAMKSYRIIKANHVLKSRIRKQAEVRNSILPTLSCIFHQVSAITSIREPKNRHIDSENGDASNMWVNLYAQYKVHLICLKNDGGTDSHIPDRGPEMDGPEDPRSAEGWLTRCLFKRRMVRASDSIATSLR